MKTATQPAGLPRFSPDRPAAAHDDKRAWAAYAAAAWALLFAAQSLAAAIIVTAGSSFGAETFGAGIARMARQGDAGLIATLWIAFIAKALAGALALAPVRSWGRRLPRRPLAIATYVVGALVLLYGLANLVEHVLMKTGAITIPHGLGARALPWHLWLWDPYWIVGGVLFLAAARAVSHCNEKPRLAERR